MGRIRTTRSDRFRFEYYQRDAETVKGLATRVEALYAGLRGDAGLEPPPADEKLTVQIVPRTDVVDWHFTGDTLTVPSPALLPVPVEYSDEVRLTRSVARPLARRVLDEALQAAQVEPGWRLMTEGLHHWLGWDGSTLPSAWRYHAEGLLREQLEKRGPLHLTDLTAPVTEQWDRSDWWLRTMAAETIVEYAVDAYSRERLPALLGGLGEYETWDTLIPAVFGVPADEFEAGWQAYVATHYARLTEAQPRSE